MDTILTGQDRPGPARTGQDRPGTSTCVPAASPPTLGPQHQEGTVWLMAT